MKRMVYTSILITLLSLSTDARIARIYGQSQPIEEKVPFIRVKMKNSFERVKIKGLDIKRKFHLTNDTRFFPGRKKISINCNYLSRKQNFEKPTLVASFASSTGLLTVKNDKYQGLVHVVANGKDDQCDVINETDLETYLGGLLSKEMNASWPIEALKAQAVAARTYAYHKIKTLEVARHQEQEHLFHLENSEKHQVSGDFFDSTFRTKKATESTEGEILLESKGKLTSVFFHASCGGKTLLPHQVWQNKVKSYRSVQCRFCNKSKKKHWNHVLKKKDWDKFVDWLIKEKYVNESVKFQKNKKRVILPSKKWDRYFRVYLGDTLVRVKKSHIRRYFGRFKIRSNNFKMVTRKGKTYLYGNGHGHGVGMCQLGALDLAKKGMTYRQILAHYFPAHNIKKIY